MKLSEVQTLTERPKCQDGRVCKGQNNGILAVFPQNTEIMFVCWECYKAIEKENSLAVPYSSRDISSP